MKEWLKFFGLSFYSDDIARQAPRRGLGNIFLAALLSALFLILGLVMAYTLTFSANFSNSPSFTATVERAFSKDGAALEVKGGKLYADRVINTAGNDDDKENYSRGFDIVVDTRPADAFDDFTAYCVSASGKRITYEQYNELDADSKSLYKFKVEYSGKERVIDEGWVSTCESYLDGRTDERTIDAYDQVKKKPSSQYPAALYELYVRTYYPSMKEYESNGKAPKLRNFYFHNYGKRDNILFVFDDSMLGSFETNTGARHTFYGYYNDIKDGKIGSSKESARDFIKDSFASATAITAYNAVVGFFSVAPFMVLVVVAVAIAMYCFSRLLKTEDIRFGAAAKTVCSFMMWSAFFTAFATFALGFLASQSIMAWLEGVVFFAVLSIRTAVMLARAQRAQKRVSGAATVEPKTNVAETNAREPVASENSGTEGDPI